MTKVRAILQRRWPLLVITSLLGVLAGVASTLIGSGDTATSFEAEQVLVASPPVGAGAVAQGNVTQDQLKVTRGEVPAVAAGLLGEPGQAEELARDITVTSDPDSNSITLIARDSDPERASDVVQAFSQGFLQVVNEELRGEDDRQLGELQRRADEAAAALEAFDEANASVLRPDVPVQQSPALDALIAERQRLVAALTQAEDRSLDFELQLGEREPYTTLGPENPRSVAGGVLAIPASVPFRAVLLGLVGLMLGVGLVVVLERLYRRVDTREELAGIINVPILAEVGRVSEKERVGSNGMVAFDGRWAEHYRRVRSAIQFVQAGSATPAEGAQTSGAGPTSQQSGAVISGHGSGHGSKVFLFASAMPGDGKSTSTALTALALAETGTDTLVINADFRRPTLEKYLGVAAHPSLEDLAELRPDRPSVDQIVQATSAPHLWMAAAGPPTLEVKGRLQAARELASETASRGGTVLIDSAPLWVTNDPIDLLPVVDEVIMVVRAGRTTTKALLDTLQLLDMHHAPVLGVILLGTVTSNEMYGYYDGRQDAAVAGRRSRGAAPVRPTPQPPQPSPGPFPSSTTTGGPTPAAAPAPEQQPTAQSPAPAQPQPAASTWTTAAPATGAPVQPQPATPQPSAAQPSAEPIVQPTVSASFLPPNDFPDSTPPSAFVASAPGAAPAPQASPAPPQATQAPAQASTSPMPAPQVSAPPPLPAPPQAPPAPPQHTPAAPQQTPPPPQAPPATPQVAPAAPQANTPAAPAPNGSAAPTPDGPFATEVRDATQRRPAADPFENW